MLNSIDKLEVIKKAINVESVNQMCDEIIEDIKMKIIVLDDYASEIRALKKKLGNVREDYKKELRE